MLLLKNGVHFILSFGGFLYILDDDDFVTKKKDDDVLRYSQPLHKLSFSIDLSSMLFHEAFLLGSTNQLFNIINH